MGLLVLLVYMMVFVFFNSLKVLQVNPYCGLQSKLILKARFYPKGKSVENKWKWAINCEGNGVTRYHRFRFEFIYV